MDLVDAAELLLGSAVLITGLGLSALAAYTESFPGVFTGFALFLAGYKLSQVAVRDTPDTPLRRTVSDLVAGAEPVDLLMTVVGIGAIAYGFTVLFRAYGRTDVVMAGVAAATMFAGYTAAHYGVNKTLV
ncbi:MAG: hypothetical protein SVU88_02190 [Candidatus Nanohaloarchaea archaeon]|nr:hypothetical protein [Candidatus Nanohaloarchaea archaeon]